MSRQIQQNCDPKEEEQRHEVFNKPLSLDEKDGSEIRTDGRTDRHRTIGLRFPRRHGSDMPTSITQ